MNSPKRPVESIPGTHTPVADVLTNGALEIQAPFPTRLALIVKERWWDPGFATPDDNAMALAHELATKVARSYEDRLGKSDKAVEYYRKALSIDPKLLLALAQQLYLSTQAIGYGRKGTHALQLALSHSVSAMQPARMARTQVLRFILIRVDRDNVPRAGVRWNAARCASTCCLSSL